jgi:hypothetical protein
MRTNETPETREKLYLLEDILKMNMNSYEFHFLRHSYS